MKVVKLKIINKKKSLLINWNNGKKTRFHSIWLRYNSNDSQTRSTQNGQRLITLNDIDQNYQKYGVFYLAEDAHDHFEEFYWQNKLRKAK